jgi:hypothetical protein
VPEESDYIWGAEAIAEFLQRDCGMTDVTTKAVYHLADRNKLPIAKWNGKLFVSRSVILAQFRTALDQAVARCHNGPPATSRTTATVRSAKVRRIGKRHRIR